MIPVELSEAADADLVSILDYSTDAFGRDAAEAYLRLIDEMLDRLADFPKLGSPRSELRKGLRSAPIKEHRIYYRLTAEKIVVVRVLHKAMDVERHF